MVPGNCRAHRRAPALFLSAALALGACAAPQSPYRTPDHWSKEGYEWPPGSGAEAVAQKSLPEQRRYNALAKEAPPDQDFPGTAPQPGVPPVVGSLPRVAPPPPTLAPLQKGRECLRDLKKSGVRFETLGDLKGVENPVEVIGKLGGITFWASDRRPLELDCRLALALQRLAPVFAQYKVTRARFSGAYAYRRTRSGRLSHHALGLAIDLHELEFGTEVLSVEKDFARGVACQNNNPILNRLACSMRDQKMFEEFLTPDYNFDHRDHLHISVPRQRLET